MTSRSEDKASGGPLTERSIIKQISHHIQRIVKPWAIEDLAVVVVGCALALALRYFLRAFATSDYEEYTSRWFDFIRANGEFAALKFDFSNYTPPYLYLLAISGALFSGLHKVTAIKVISIPFDFLCAYLVARLVKLRHPRPAHPIAAFLLILFTPTVFINGSFWGQIDIIYTTGLVATVYSLSRGKESLAILAFGVALSFKLQTLFFAPCLAIFALSRTIRWRSFLLVPMVYFIMMLPAWLAGRPLGELMTIYISQSAAPRLLVTSAPNLYAWLPKDMFEFLLPPSLVWASSVILIFVYATHRKVSQMTPGLLIELSTISLLLAPYILPKMRQRYFFPADVFSIVFGFFYPKYMIVPVIVQMVSLFSYFPFLFGYEIIPLKILAIIELVPIVILGYHFVSRLGPGGTNAGNAAAESPQ